MKGIKTILGIALATAGFGGAIAVGASATNNHMNEVKADTMPANTVIYLTKASNISDDFYNYGVVAIWNHGGSVFDQFSYDSESGYYKATLSVATSGFNIFRGESLDWNTKWDQSGDSTFLSGNNLLTVTGWSNNTITFTQGSYVPTVKVTKYAVYDGVVDTEYPLGTDTISSGSTYSKPAAVYKAGNTFGGWYSNAACTIEWNESATIASNTSIYAKYTWHGNWEGSIFVDLASSGWDDSAANYAVYFYDSHGWNGWSSYTALAINNFKVEISYSIGFEPDNMILMRYNSTYNEASWESNRWDSNVWFHSEDLDYSSSVVISDYDTTNDKWYAYTGDAATAVVQGAAVGSSWADIATLSNRKTNDSHHVEYYSSTVTLPANSEFKVVHGYTYYGYYSCHSSLDSIFGGGEGNNITCSTAGTYTMYFDSNSHNVYITKAELAAADEWAQTFLGANCTATKGNWSSLATSFAALDSSVKAVFTGVAYMAPDAATSTYYEAAVQRYDLIIMTYGKAAYNDFMGRESAQSLTYKASAVVSPLTINSSNAPALVIVVSSIAFTLATGGYFFLRKKKEQ